MSLRLGECGGGLLGLGSLKRGRGGCSGPRCLSAESLPPGLSVHGTRENPARGTGAASDSRPVEGSGAAAAHGCCLGLWPSLLVLLVAL